jgi:hypothetical protein
MLPPSAQRLIEFSGFSKHMKQVVHFPHIPTGQVLIERKCPVKLCVTAAKQRTLSVICSA